jgi:hypothetical protein
MLLSRRFHKIFWDTYVSRGVSVTPLLRAKAVVRLVPSGSFISHHTAAELWGGGPGRWGHACHLAVGPSTPSSTRRPFALSEISGSEHTSQGPAHLHA